jgi:hypothetical protein
MPNDQFQTDLELLEKAEFKEPDLNEIPWSEACARAGRIDVTLHWGDGYDLFVGVRDTRLAVVVDGTSEKLNQLDVEMAITVTDLLARRAGLAVDMIRFPHPRAVIDRGTLLDWLEAVPTGSQAAVEIAAAAEELRLPWFPDPRKGGR